MKQVPMVLVNENDVVLGTADKLQVHENGWLHRAFSIVLYNTKGEMLLQQRALEKYHSGGLFTNACCSHAVLQESVLYTARQRLGYEMGLETELQYAGHLIYKGAVSNNLIEHEYDHLFTGICDDIPQPHVEEVMAFSYFPIDQLHTWLNKKPELFSLWFRLIFEKIHPDN